MTPESLELQMQLDPLTAQLYDQFPTQDAEYVFGNAGSYLSRIERSKALRFRGRIDSRAALAGRIGS